jgi:hypothetical protein
MSAPTYTSPAGVSVPVVTSAILHHYTDEIRAASDAGVIGLGSLAVILDKAGQPMMWVYCAPNRPPTVVSGYYDRIEPPPLPQPVEKRERCGCRQKEHVCGSCGQPHWIEIHGMGDGFCTYCYARG